LLLAVLARLDNTGGKRCFVVKAQTYPSANVGGKPEVAHALVFLPKVWEQIMNPKSEGYPSREPPTVKEMAFFVRGYLRALTGVKPTVL
jgi:hypothetical protein